MRILIDIGHPGHVHLFKHLAHRIEQDGGEVLFTVRDKECELELLEAEHFPYKNFGKPIYFSGHQTNSNRYLQAYADPMRLVLSFSELFQCIQNPFHDEKKDRLPDSTKYSTKKLTRNWPLSLIESFLHTTGSLLFRSLKLNSLASSPGFNLQLSKQMSRSIGFSKMDTIRY